MVKKWNLKRIIVYLYYHIIITNKRSQYLYIIYFILYCSNLSSYMRENTSFLTQKKFNSEK